MENQTPEPQRIRPLMPWEQGYVRKLKKAPVQPKEPLGTFKTDDGKEGVLRDEFGWPLAESDLPAVF